MELHHNRKRKHLYQPTILGNTDIKYVQNKTGSKASFFYEVFLGSFYIEANLPTSELSCVCILLLYWYFLVCLMLPYHQSHCANSLGPKQYIFHILIWSIATRMVSGAFWCSTSIYWTHINNQVFLVGQNEAYKKITLMSSSLLKFPSKKISEYLSYAPLCVEWNLQKVSAGIQQLLNI